MIRPLSSVLAGIAIVGALAACGPDISSPIAIGGARFSGGSTSSGGAAGGGGGTKAACSNTLSVTGAATEALTGNAFSATYVLNACQPKTRVSMTATDLATGQVVWQSLPDIVGTIAIWGLPYTLTSYRVDARAVTATGALVATASTVISTIDPLPCTPFVHETATVGYWGIYAAVWAASDAQDCGLSGTVHLQIRNMNTGMVELDYPNLGKSSFIDFEGPIVSYNTPYRVYAELRGSNGDLLASSTTDIVSSPLR